MISHSSSWKIEQKKIKKSHKEFTSMKNLKNNNNDILNNEILNK